MDGNEIKEIKEKRLVALTSVYAAVFLTSIKIIVGMATGSLGILSEALHSGLDLVAAIMTFFAVKLADKPADYNHHFGHGKIENLSALFETLILLITCFWIIYEAVERLSTGRTIIEVNFWSFAVISVSILVDITRSRALSKVAKKYKSQALEADALHFSTDILSSFVVIIGLIGATLGYHFADPVAALFVALIVITISYRLGKRSIDALLDKSPADLPDLRNEIMKEIPEVYKAHDIRLRTSGSTTFVELNIHVDSSLSIEEAHKISDKVEELICNKVGRCKVHVHIEPDSEDN